jgi:hypothetical protein
MNIRLCNKELSPLQRRTMQLFGANLGFTAVLSLATHDLVKDMHPSALFIYLTALLPTIPVVGIVVVVSRYLARETDDFIRMLVVQSLLWGLGITFVLDTYLGGLFSHPQIFRLIPILNIDLFCVSVGIAVRIQLWRNR